MAEHQYKFHIDNVDDFKEKLKQKNIEFSNPTDFIYTYFEKPTKSDSFSVLRIKESKKGNLFDMKIRKGESSQWDCFASSIDNPEDVKSILMKIGCTVIFSFNKHKQSFANDFAKLDLYTTGELGTFLEVKFTTENKEKTEQLLSELGVDISKHDNRSVIEIYLEQHKNQ